MYVWNKTGGELKSFEDKHGASWSLMLRGGIIMGEGYVIKITALCRGLQVEVSRV